MKLASLKDGSRDGRLHVVSQDMTRMAEVSDEIHDMQTLLDNWDALSPQLINIYEQLNEFTYIGDVKDFDALSLESPLPRAYQWLDGSAYVNHVELVRKARGAAMPESFWTDPLMYQGGSDGFIGPKEDILVENLDWGVDFESEIAVVTDDVPMGASPEKAKFHIKLIMLVNDVSLRNLIPGELSKGFGFMQGKPATAFSPVAVTPDELDEHWDGYKVNLPLLTYFNDDLYGRPNAGKDMIFDFPTLIAHAAKTRQLCAGTIIGSGTVSNKNEKVGSSCLAEKRMIEKIRTGTPITPFMGYGDRVKIEMLNTEGESIFGSIDQQVVKYHNPELAEEGEVIEDEVVEEVVEEQQDEAV